MGLLLTWGLFLAYGLLRFQSARNTCSARELAHSRRLTLTRTKKTVKPKMQPVTSTRRSYRWEEGQEGYVAWALKPLAEVVKDTHGHTMSCTIACPQQPERSLSLGLRFSSPQRCRQFFFFFFFKSCIMISGSCQQKCIKLLYYPR